MNEGVVSQSGLLEQIPQVGQLKGEEQIPHWLAGDSLHMVFPPGVSALSSSFAMCAYDVCAGTRVRMGACTFACLYMWRPEPYLLFIQLSHL